MAISYRGRPALVTQTKSETEVPGTHDTQVQPVPSRLPVADSIYIEYQYDKSKSPTTKTKNTIIDIGSAVP